MRSTMDKSLTAETEWLKKEIKYLADCVDTSVRKGKVIELVKRMNGMPLHHAKSIFKQFIDNCDKFPSIKDFNERIVYYQNLDLEDLKKYESTQNQKQEVQSSVFDDLTISARPMKLLLKNDPKKFNKIKEEHDKYFPNALAQASNVGSCLKSKDLRIDACFTMMNEFYTNPKKVLQEQLESCTPGVRRNKLLEGIKSVKFQ